MAIQHAVLALLARGPSYGYELKGAFEAAVGPQWGPLNIGHLYQILDRLSRDGLVVAERQAQPVKPDRHLLRELRNLDGLRRRAYDPVVRLLLSAASRHVEADLAFRSRRSDAGRPGPPAGPVSRATAGGGSGRPGR